MYVSYTEISFSIIHLNCWVLSKLPYNICVYKHFCNGIMRIWWHCVKYVYNIKGLKSLIFNIKAKIVSCETFIFVNNIILLRFMLIF